MIQHNGKRNRNRQSWQKWTALTLLATLVGSAQGQSNDPVGGYLDWVFYDDLPASERDRISRQCPGSFIDPWTDTDIPADSLEASADRQSGNLDRSIRLENDVQISHAVLRLYSETATYDTNTGQVALPDGGIVRQPDLAINTRDATAETERDEFQLYDASYTLHMANLHGDAREISRQDNQYQLNSAWITRCAPGSFGWSLHASTLNVDTDTNIATGYNTRLHVGPVPVAYTPYFRLNLAQERSSGFLAPTATYYARYNQLRIGTPYYWAIAPNLDSTTTVDWIAGGDPDDDAPQIAHVWQEWRYLQSTFEGELVWGTYPGWNDPNSESPEWGVDLSLNSRETDLEWTLDFRDADSANYFPEFLGEPYRPTVTNRLTAGYEVPATDTRIDARLEDQNIFGEAASVSDLDYVEQPGLHLRQPLSLPADWQLQGLADWERRHKKQPDYLVDDISPSALDPYDAVRLRNRAVLSRSDSWNQWTLTQQYTGDHTYYTMPTFDDHPTEGYNRLLWDTRHRLSYRQALPWDQTLTPFAQYEYRPLDERQIDLPLMNTSVDRLRDRNRVTLGTRYDLPREHWRLRSDLDQVFNLNKELLANTSIREDDWTNPQASTITWRNSLGVGEYSEFGTTLAWRPDRESDDGTEDLSFYGEEYQTSRVLGEYTYARNRGGFNIRYDWNLSNDDDEDDPLTRLDMAAVAPVTSVFGVFGYLNWEQTDEEDELELAETIAGLEYDGCCWHIQLAGQRFVNADPEQSPSSGLFDTIQLNLTLKGLGNVGGRNTLADRMRERIPTFRNQLFDTQ